MAQDLGTRTARGAVVMTLGARAAPLIKTVAFLFLARLLDPKDFGLVSMAMILLGATDLFAGLGMGSALIQTKLETRSVAFPAFAITAVSGLFFWLLVVTQSSWLAGFLGDPAVAPVLRWLGAVVLLDSLLVVPEALLRKRLVFQPVALAIVVASLVGNGLAIGLALLGFGVWSLVGGELARALTRLGIVSIAERRWEWLRPKGSDWAAMKGLSRYGIQATGGGLLTYLNTNWDDWLVGRVLGSTALGFYSKAYHLTNRGIVDFHKKMSAGVLFPSYAQIQEDKERLSRIYLKTLSMIGLITTPLAAGLFVLAPEGIGLVLGEKWLPMVPTVRVLCLMALVRPFAASTSPVFLGVGRPDLNVRAAVVTLATMVPLVFLLLDRGIVGVAAADAISFTVGFVYTLWLMGRILPGIAPRMLRAILPCLVASGVMMVGVFLSKAPLEQLAGGQHNLFSLAVMISIGGFLYALTVFVLQRELILEAVSLVINAFVRRKHVALDRG